MRRSWVTLLLAMGLAGCASAGSADEPGSEPTSQPVAGAESSVTWCEKINPIWWLGDNSPIPHDFQPNSPLREEIWFFRNPFHNFTFYVIGISDHVGEPAFVRFGSYPHDNFAPIPGWNFCVIHYHCLRLPFVSYWNRHFRFYLGWRLAGEFGVKVDFAKVDAVP